MMYTAGNGKNATKSHSNKAELQATESKNKVLKHFLL